MTRRGAHPPRAHRPRTTESGPRTWRHSMGAVLREQRRAARDCHEGVLPLFVCVAQSERCGNPSSALISAIKIMNLSSDHAALVEEPCGAITFSRPVGTYVALRCTNNGTGLPRADEEEESRKP